MLFPTLLFALFFLVVWAGDRLLPNKARSGWLLAASLLFYSLWIPQYLGLLLFVVLVNYGFLRGLQRSQRLSGGSVGSGRAWLIATLVFTLGILATFKYAAFLIGIVLPFSTILADGALPVPDLLLPLGISFYSFQLISLHVDVYRREIEAPPSLARYALFVSFFPQLIAGPILRGQEFLPQLAGRSPATTDRNRRGLWLIASGLWKKVLLGDFLFAPMVDPVFANPGLASAPLHLLAIYGFAFQIYFDFSGYTDMARGIALLLGFEFPRNFEEPYLSRSPTEFWRRWHMTLSRWLRDYLYIPLGGNRGSSFRTGTNLLITMLLGGLWHGAGWNFVIWGGLHGVLLALHRPLRGRQARPDTLAWKDWWRVLLCFNAVTFLWIFFRAATFADACDVIAGAAFGTWAVPLPIWGILLVIAAFLLQFAERWIRRRADRLRRQTSGMAGAVFEGLAFGGLLILVIAASGRSGEFIYFQF
jgi:D-alanyl-lipoteichoic acid acyltransferase DltB (MBOAT superfamily)